ncbi:MAG: carbohydrate kinase [Planctomycetia bacterium]|nr:carbohydrate kinase [Planctomycetia bacterium]
MKTILGLGELLWDCFAEERRPGGAPANVAFQANQLGFRGVVCSRVGDDPLGHELFAFLHSCGLTTEGVQRDPRYPTGTVTVDTTQSDAPEYVIHENVAWDFLEFTDVLGALAAEASAVCFGTLAQRNVVTAQTMRELLDAVRPGCLKVYDVNLRQHFYQRDVVERSFHQANVVKLNEGEVNVVSRLLGFSEEPPAPIAFARWVCETYRVEQVCVTRGDRGCLLVTPDEVVDEIGKPVAVVDTVGSGDAFTAALIYGVLEGFPLEKQAHFANAVGGLVATRRGGMPDLKEELDALK